MGSTPISQMRARQLPSSLRAAARNPEWQADSRPPPSAVGRPRTALLARRPQARTRARDMMKVRRTEKERGTTWAAARGARWAGNLAWSAACSAVARRSSRLSFFPVSIPDEDRGEPIEAGPHLYSSDQPSGAQAPSPFYLFTLLVCAYRAISIHTHLDVHSILSIHFLLSDLHASSRIILCSRSVLLVVA